MNTDKHKLLYAEEIHAIIGCAFEVLNTLGHGLLEKSYENALTVELGLKAGLVLNFKQSKLSWKKFVL
jgi:hypothetical protein